jgi:hypothetical protein
MQTIEVDGGFLRLEGTEADLARMLAKRQALGLRKYQTSVRKNPLELRQWLMHSLEEKLDDCVYMLRAIEQIDRESDDNK